MIETIIILLRKVKKKDTCEDVIVTKIPSRILNDEQLPNLQPPLTDGGQSPAKVNSGS